MSNLKVGNLEFKSNIFLAPMAGITDTVFRQLVRRFSNHCVLFTEMISSEGLALNHDVTVTKSEECEHPLIYQISGHKPHLMAKAAKALESKADIIDINMGCPVNKIVRGSDGCALMKDLKLASAIISEVKKNISIPLSVKTRLGWDMNSKNYLEFSKMAEDSGVDMLTVHGRTRSQMYSGTASWEEIAQIKQNVKIPVIANGDIVSPESAKRCLELTKCDGLAVGRALLGDVELISRIETYLETGVLNPPLNIERRLETALEHCKMEMALRGDDVGIKFMRKFFAWYVVGIKNAAKHRFELVRVESLDEVRKLFLRIIEEQSVNV